MKQAYDLHIHSCLSPCASDDMTPKNIAAMARLKGLSIISLTDHNTGRNLEAMAAAAQENGLIFLPGIEVNTQEEVHVLVYFTDVGTAVEFGDNLYDSLPDIPNRPDIFGRQIIMDDQDSVSGELDKLLLQATPYSIDNIADMARNAGGCAVPAHINRPSFSILSNLGFIPSGLFNTVEISQSHPRPNIDQNLSIIYSSDAHDLGAISEPKHTFSCIISVNELMLFIFSGNFDK